MGCDIHVMVEARDYILGPNHWFNVDDWRRNPYAGEEDEPELFVSPIYTQRNYELFSFLADVRNYSHNPTFGFDRGFPEDACKHTREFYVFCGEGAHTPGYATLAELKEKIGAVHLVKRSGYVHRDQIVRMKKTGELPTSWNQGVYGPSAEQYEWLEWQAPADCFDKLLAALEERKREVFWMFNQEEDDGANDGNIRIVFWFDN